MTNLRNPKLLFLAWNFPPVQNIASVRTWNVAKQLSRLGWDVTVVTPRHELWRHLDDVASTNARIEKEGIKRIFTDHRWRCLTPEHLRCWNQSIGWVIGGVARSVARKAGVDWGVGWIRPAERSCRIPELKDVDLILASGPPFATFMLAERLAHRFGRPYVLDYRDVWTEDDDHQGLLPTSQRLEARLLAGAGAVTAVSPSIASHLASRFGVESKLDLITNGYDHDELRDIAPHAFSHFAIVYAGIFYPPERIITPLLQALKQLDWAGNDIPWVLHYYGDHGNHVRDEAIRIGMLNSVKLHGIAPRSEVLSALRGADLALVISSVFDKGSLKINAVPGKLFEVIGLGSPCLLITPEGSDAASIAGSSGSVCSFKGTDINGIRRFIERLMTGWRPTPVTNDRLEWRCLAQTLDSHLRRCLPEANMRTVSSFIGGQVADAVKRHAG